MDVQQFICLPGNEYLGYFHFGAIINKAVINIYK